MVWYVMYKFRNVCTVYVFCVCVCRGKWGYKEWGGEGAVRMQEFNMTARISNAIHIHTKRLQCCGSV